MSTSACFNTGFFVTDQPGEDVYLSVTPGFEGGPGIERDGITAPRMPDPHTIEPIRNQYNLPPGQEKRWLTTDPWEQRAGTWTVYHHVKTFMETRPDLLVVGVQSNGDLTMNPWHIAYIGQSHLEDQNERICGLLLDEPREPIQSRNYRCLVKWKKEVAAATGQRYDFLNLRIQKVPPRGRYTAKLYDTDDFGDGGKWLEQYPEYHDRCDIGPLVEFALSGKSIVERSLDLSLSSASDRFQDLRHIFDLPDVPARGSFRGATVNNVNLGEYQLFHSLNERRAALSGPVVIDFDIGDSVEIRPDSFMNTMLENRFRVSSEPPTRPGQFRRYSADANHERVEIYFPHNVYPFGALGIEAGKPSTTTEQLVCLSAGGLSGRVGNTLEGITRIMYDFFGCTDAMILDEGLDVFSIVNRAKRRESDGEATVHYTYDNATLLQKILGMTRDAIERDAGQVKRREEKGICSYRHGSDFTEWSLNRSIMNEVKQAGPDSDDSDVVLVRPQRSQIRSVLIFAVPNPNY